jgi:hypothetical protein
MQLDFCPFVFASLSARLPLVQQSGFEGRGLEQHSYNIPCSLIESPHLCHRLASFFFVNLWQIWFKNCGQEDAVKRKKKER